MTPPRQRPTVCRNRIGSTETFFRAAHSPCLVTFSGGSGLESEPETAAVLLTSKCFFVMATVPGLARAVGVYYFFQLFLSKQKTFKWTFKAQAAWHLPLSGCIAWSSGLRNFSQSRQETGRLFLLHGFAVTTFFFITIKGSGSVI